jgi:hypothetical protein
MTEVKQKPKRKPKYTRGQYQLSAFAWIWGALGLGAWYLGYDSTPAVVCMTVAIVGAVILAELDRSLKNAVRSMGAAFGRLLKEWRP